MLTPIRTRSPAGCFGALCLLAIASAANVRGEESVIVSATGEGYTEEEACRDAIRKAVERGGKVEFDNRSQGENYELFRDTLYAQSDTLVTDYDTIRTGNTAGGKKYCEVRATVSKTIIASRWGNLQTTLAQIGRPGVAVFILERIDGVKQDSSILESNIESRLLARGFKVYAGEQLRAISEKESADAQAESNIAKLNAIAKDFGTQIFITGTAQANAAGVKDLYGQEVAMYNGDAMVKMYYTDTGELLASESVSNWRGGARGMFEHSPQAGKKALENAAVELVDRVYDHVMRQWSSGISGGGEIELQIEGMRIADALRLKRKIRDIDTYRITRVDGPSATKGVTTFRIQARMSAEDLASYLVEGDWARIIEVVDLKPNRIQAKKIAP